MRSANGNFRPDIIKPRVLDPITAMRYHPNAAQFAKEGHVVMFTTGAKVIGGALPGEHDGIRDGGSPAWLDARKNHIVYVPLQDWLEEGYPDPR